MSLCGGDCGRDLHRCKVQKRSCGRRAQERSAGRPAPPPARIGDTDSRDLRSVNAVGGSAKPFRRKFFFTAPSHATALRCAAEICRKHRRCKISASQNAKRERSESPYFIGVSLQPRNLVARVIARRCDDAGGLVLFSRRCRSRRMTAPLTHKIKWSDCYFFPSVVIGDQCGSIRDCTTPIAIHSD